MQVSGICLAIVLGLSATAQAEVLGHISDDTETATPSQTVEPSRDRQIIYRVICNPQGEQLPDCEQPVNDVEFVEGGKPAEDTTPSFPPDPADAVPSESEARPMAAAVQPKSPTNIAQKAPASKKVASGKSDKTSGKVVAKAKGAKKADKSTKSGKTSKDSKPAKKTKK